MTEVRARGLLYTQSASYTCEPRCCFQIRFARRHVIAMEVALRSLANVRELLNILDEMESTQFSSFLDSWRERMYRAIDYHPATVDEVAYFDTYDPWECRKIDHHTATNRASATRAFPEDMPFGWCHQKIDIKRTTRDESSDLNGYVWVTDSLPRMN